MMGIDQLEKMQALHENGLQVSVVADVRDLIASHIETIQALNKARTEIKRLESLDVTDVVYLAWPNPEKAQFERRSRPSANPALGVAVFTEELAALRFANDSDAHYRVTRAPFGMTINQARYDAKVDSTVDPDPTEIMEPF